MKKYLVYVGKSPEGSIRAVDYQQALARAKRLAPKEHRSQIRVRLARPGTLLGALANQKQYGY